MSTFDGDVDDIKALGHSALGLVSMAIMLAIVAVLLTSPNTPVMLAQFFAFLRWLVGNIIAPLQPGTTVNLGASYADAGGFPTSTGGTTGTTTPATSPGTSTGGTSTTGGGTPGPSVGTPQAYVAVDANGVVIPGTQTLADPAFLQYAPLPAGAAGWKLLGASP